MLREIFGVTLATTIVALVAAVSVIGMILVMTATDVLTQTGINTDSPYFADLTDDCDFFQSVTCDYSLN